MWQMQEQTQGIFMRCRDIHFLDSQTQMWHRQEWDAVAVGEEETEGERGGEGGVAGIWRWGRAPEQGEGGVERR